VPLVCANHSRYELSVNIVKNHKKVHFSEIQIFNFFSNLDNINSNLKIKCNYKNVSKKCKNGGGGVLVKSPVSQALKI